MAKIVLTQRVVYSYFGFMSISAVLKSEGHEVELVMESDPISVADEILSINPDMVAFSVLMATGEYEWACDIVRKLKSVNPKILIIFGGTQATFLPEETMKEKGVDVIALGEGELAFKELAKRFDEGCDYSDIAGLWVRTGHDIQRNQKARLIENLDSLPFPDRELYQKYDYFTNLDSIEVLAGRGCLFSCSYCLNTSSKELERGQGKFVRKHSVYYMLDQLEGLKTKYKPKSFTFFDELFTVNKSWVREFTKEYPKRIGLPFICNVTADTIDEESCVLLAKAGVSRVCFGVESGNEHMRMNVLNKQVTNEQYLQTAERLHKHGIKFLTSNMIGLPGETVEQAFETVTLNQKMKTDYLYFSVFQPYPKLPITRQLEANGQLKNMASSEYETTFFKGSLIEQDNMDELVNLHKFFYLLVKIPGLKPVVKRLIKLPPNKAFEWIFILSFGWMQFTCFNRNPLQLIQMGFGNLKVFYGRKRNKNANVALAEV